MHLEFLRQIGGWKNGTGEDLDLTLRIKAYFKRHPKLNLIHEPDAIVHTDVPDTVVSFLKQRFRWDGALFYLYCRRHWRTLRPKYLGWKNFIGTIWYGLLMQIVLPFAIILYLYYLFAHYTLAYIIILFSIIYLYYMLTMCLFFVIYISLVSERKSYDCRFCWVFPLFPIYQMFVRIWSAVAILYEIVMHTHKNSNMAPWWVIRKTD